MPQNQDRRRDAPAGSTAATANMITETYYGLVQTPRDAYLLIQACRSGMLNRITRRMTDVERARLIRPGAVFVFEEEESGIRRWTDHIRWSRTQTLTWPTPMELILDPASRVSGAFLIYSELHAPGERLDNGSIMYKQSFSSTPKPGEKYHLIAYYDRAVLESGTLSSPSSEDRFNDLDVPRGGFFNERPDARPAIARVTQTQPQPGRPGPTSRQSAPSVGTATPATGATPAQGPRPDAAYGQLQGGGAAYPSTAAGSSEAGGNHGKTPAAAPAFDAMQMQQPPYYNANAGAPDWTQVTRAYADAMTMAYAGSGFAAPGQPPYGWRQPYPSGLTYPSSSGGYSSDADYDPQQWLAGPIAGPSNRPFTGGPPANAVAGASTSTTTRHHSASASGQPHHPQALDLEDDSDEFILDNRAPSP